ncbi:formate hydrogenlyase complex iron-sulfur subunit [Photobacterium jeanii]|uniref:Formate hydrogenlyase complex iron-sulfur subunit n=1 Tax=Photobacterium jeanii TaxID=858640 RepID=A0A178K3L9_9GAMM|nr:formate hydrogenlyase complex iron-sulfur subunit [Photobacterium jeanii]OAN11313.1 formate hydrogenlyase complex iron-sulfur subunit [Photobacterium jeanii]PST90834.1 4Fe-4S dicluster domain-containing protein [Photobacterium jeanii]
MFKVIKTIIKAGESTKKYPFVPLEVSDDFRGKPEYNPEQCIACAACTRACPANALIMETDAAQGTRRWQLSIARCIFCGRCEEVCPTKAIKLSKEFELAVCNKEDLYQEANFSLTHCRECDTAFAPRKAVEYALDLLQQAGMSDEQLNVRRQQLETCPACRRKQNMMDAANVFHTKHLNKEVADERN